MSKLTEELLAVEFEKMLISNSINQFPKFNSVFREVSCFQGIPDFIAISGENIDLIEYSSSKELSIDSSSLILSLLKKKAPRSEEFLVRSSGLAPQTITKILVALKKSNIVSVTNSGGYFLGPNYKKPNVELWAFELKLENWKRALFQALQYKAFANRVIIVFPSNKAKLLKRNLEIFRTLKIGVMTLDVKDRSFEIILKPYKLKPSSNYHNLFALSRIADEMLRNTGLE